jgi:hypothetical protein
LEFSTTSKELELPPSDTRSDDPAFTVIAGRSSSTVILGSRIILNIEEIVPHEAGGQGKNECAEKNGV